MSLIASPGIVLRRIRHLDVDTRLTLFLREEGKVLINVKGGQRMTSKLKALQEPFTKSDLQVFLPPHGTTGRLIQGKLIDSHEKLRYRYDTFQIASRCCEVIDALFPYRAASHDNYDLLDKTLGRLCVSAQPRFEWAQFIATLLNNLGHGDHSQEILEWAAFPLSENDLDKCVALADAQLGMVLPHSLKTEVLKT